VREDADHAGLTRLRATADRDAFVHQRRLGDPPSVADVPETVAVRDAHVGQEHLVEFGLAGRLTQRPHLQTGCRHVDQEIGHALVLGHVRIRTRDQDAALRLVRHRRPDLLAVDDPVVAVPHRPGREAGEIRAGPGFAEQLAPHLLAHPEWSQVAGALLVRAVTQDCRRGHAEPDADAARIVVGCAGRRERVDHRFLQSPRCAEAAEPDREMDPRETRIEAGSQEVDPVHGGRIMLGQERLDAGAHAGFVESARRSAGIWGDVGGRCHADLRNAAAGPVPGAPMPRPPRLDDSGGSRRTFCTHSATYGRPGLKRVR
jgi:hypothetical protein